MYPKVSIIWLNHNSKKIINIALQSLESIADLDYPSDRYELIVVDNGSTDGSFETIRSFLEKKTDLRKKIIRLDKNLGFTGGNNIGYKARDRESKYVVLLNNDAIVDDDSLEFYVDFMEQYPWVGAAQGVILSLSNPNSIDSTGFFVSNILTFHGFPKNLSEMPKNPIVCSCVEGTYPIYRVEALLKALEKEAIFPGIFFGYHEDVWTSISIWGKDFKIAILPRVVGRHRRGGTFRKPVAAYLGRRNVLAMSRALGVRIAEMYHLAITMKLAATSKFLRPYMIHAIRAYKHVAQHIGDVHNRLKMPIINIPLHIVLMGMIKRRIIDEYVYQWIKNRMTHLKIDFDF